MASSDNRHWAHLIQEVIIGAGTLISCFYIARQLLSRLDPDAGAKAESQKKALAASARLQSIFGGNQKQIEDDDAYSSDEEDDGRDRSGARPEKEDLVLNSYEQTIAMEVVSPEEIPVTFDDIGGLDSIIDDLRESIIYPLTHPHLYSAHSSLLSAPSGVLLYGPPGCGKTMLAKALARESGACFINLHISTLTEKWYGDSNKLVAAVFSLARKLQPTIVFIDEIDAVLGQRRSGEHEASGMVKAEFMTHWDGLASSTTKSGAQRICILGATNRIQDIDEAILRRLPKKFPVNLPTAKQRRQIFELTLKDTRLDSSTLSDGKKALDLNMLVRLSAGMSGSDIKEACRDAAMVPVREYIKSTRGQERKPRDRRDRQRGSATPAEEVRGLQTDDFFGRRSAAPPTRTEPSRASSKTVEDSSEVGSTGSGSTEEVEYFDDPA
nr:hypothetical protein B0A51_05247 [Rachicladosporium sp. CCFEE 5018]